MKLQELKDKIIEANPDIIDACDYHFEKGTTEDVMKSNCCRRTIRLADILIAIHKKKISGLFFSILYSEFVLGKKFITWNLKKNDLSLQEKEIINFLHEMLI